MKIELLDNFRGKHPGDVIDWPDPMAQILIDSGRAKPAGEVKEAEPVKDKMQRKAKTK